MAREGIAPTSCSRAHLLARQLWRHDQTLAKLAPYVALEESCNKDRIRPSKIDQLQPSGANISLYINIQDQLFQRKNGPRFAIVHPDRRAGFKGRLAVTHSPFQRMIEPEHLAGAGFAVVAHGFHPGDQASIRVEAHHITLLLVVKGHNE